MTDNRAPEYRAAERIAAVRAHRPQVDANGRPLPNQPRAFNYGPDSLLQSVTTTEDGPS